MARATIRARGVLSAPAACLRHAAARVCVFMVACGGSAGAASPLGVAAAGSAINHHQRRNSVYGIFGGSVGNDSAASAPAHGGGAAPLAHYVLDLTSTPCTSSRCPTTRRSLGVCDLRFGHSSSFGCSALAHPGGAPGQATHANGGARHPAPVALAVTDMRPVARDGCPVNRDAPAISQRLRVRGRAIDRWKANGVSYTLVPVRTAEGKDFLFGSRSKINTSSGISRSLS